MYVYLPVTQEQDFWDIFHFFISLLSIKPTYFLQKIQGDSLNKIYAQDATEFMIHGTISNIFFSERNLKKVNKKLQELSIFRAFVLSKLTK